MDLDKKAKGLFDEGVLTMLIVKKFGGTTVETKEDIFRVAKRCLEDYRKGHDVVIVPSAMGSHTEELIEQAKMLNPDPSARDMDMLLSISAQMSAAFMAMAFETMDVPAVSLNAYQVKISTTEEHGNAEITGMETGRILDELNQRKIVIVTGGLGILENNDITTLAGGAEATAVALAEALQADICEIYGEAREEMAVA